MKKIAFSLFIYLIINIPVLPESLWTGNGSVSQPGEFTLYETSDNKNFAASNSFPTGTVVKVKNPSTAATVEVEIVKGLRQSGLFILISPSAGEKIGLSSDDVYPVQVSVVESGEDEDTLITKHPEDPDTNPAHSLPVYSREVSSDSEILLPKEGGEEIEEGEVTLTEIPEVSEGEKTPGEESAEIDSSYVPEAVEPEDPTLLESSHPIADPSGEEVPDLVDTPDMHEAETGIPSAETKDISSEEITGDKTLPELSVKDISVAEVSSERVEPESPETETVTVIPEKITELPEEDTEPEEYPEEEIPGTIWDDLYTEVPDETEPEEDPYDISSDELTELTPEARDIDSDETLKERESDVTEPSTPSEPETLASKEDETGPDSRKVYYLVPAGRRPPSGGKSDKEILSVKSEVPISDTGIYIQIGIYDVKTPVEPVLQPVKQIHLPHITVTDENNRHKRVLVGPLKNDEMGIVMHLLRQSGFNDFFTYKKER